MKVLWVLTMMLIAALAAAACGGGDDEPAVAVVPAGAPTSSGQAETPIPADAPGEAPAGPPPSGGAEVDASATDALVFERREIVSEVVAGDPSTRLGSVTVGIPVGWDESPNFPGLFGLLSDPFGPTFNVGSSCGGGCVERTDVEWAAVVEDAEFSQFRDAENFTIEIEEDLADGKLVVATNSFGVEIVSVARWIPGRTEYFYCRFTTDDSGSYPLGAFEEACRGASIEDLPASASP